MKKIFKTLLMSALIAVTAIMLFGIPEKASAAEKLSAPVIKGKSSSVKTITLKWDTVSGADGYKIYKYNSKKHKYKLCATVEGGSSNIFELGGLNSGKTYKFKIAAYVNRSGKAEVQTKSKVVKIKTAKVQNNSLADFIVYDENMKSHMLSDYFGKPVIINIWATWCGPCVRELPHFEKYYKEYGDKIKFLMINCESKQDLEYIKEFLDENDYTFPIYYDFDDIADFAYGNGYIPMTVVIRKDGTIVYHDSGSLSEDALKNLIDTALK